MSSRARRLGAQAPRDAFDWGADGSAVLLPMAARPATPMRVAPAATDGSGVDPSAVERDAFAKGYAQGERAGTEAATARADAMLQRLATTIEELQTLRAEVIRRTERQVVALALAIARRIVLREVSLDPELLLAMARVALDRLTDTSTASIHLHPDDHAAAVAPRGAAPASDTGVAIVADPSVRRGGCVVRSDFGSIDIAVGAQLDELTHTLFGDGHSEAGPESSSHADTLTRS